MYFIFTLNLLINYKNEKHLLIINIFYTNKTNWLIKKYIHIETMHQETWYLDFTSHPWLIGFDPCLPCCFHLMFWAAGGRGEYIHIYILGQICLAHYSILSACIWCSWIMGYHEVAQLKVCSEGKPFSLSNKNDVAFEHQLCEENNFLSWHCHSLVPFLHFLEPMYIGLQQSISLCRLPRKGSNR